MKRGIVYLLAAVCVVGFPLTLYLIFSVAGLMDLLYFSQKIFYYHVPSAWMLFVFVIVSGIASLFYLRTRKPEHDDVAEAAAETAVMLGAIVLATGMIWGKAAWGVWWQWDARLTQSLLLWMIMIGCLLVRQYGGPGSERLAAGLAVFGMADVPLIYYSVKIWRTLHPDTSVVPSLQGNMRIAFWTSGLVMTCFYVLLFMARLALARSRRLLRDARELAVDEGLL